MCQLASLVPALKVETADYERFSLLIVNKLWSHISANTDAKVCAAAYDALSYFLRTTFEQRHLPVQVRIS